MLASKVKMSVVLFPQLLGEYDSLIKDHEGLKVMILSLKFTLKPYCDYLICLASWSFPIYLSTEQPGVSRE